MPLASTALHLPWPVGLAGSYGGPGIMGILNVTPDSFSDGGQWSDPQIAAEHGMKMVQQGANIIDIGGESTRPGSEPVSSAKQIKRVIPVIICLKQAMAQANQSVPISIDTTQSQVAQAALDAGASFINDVSAGVDDPQMLSLTAFRKVPICLMHRLGQSRTMQENPQYDDVVAQVGDFLVSRAKAAMEAGVLQDQIVLDPGIGFGKSKAHNLQLLGNLRSLVGLGYPVLLGTSRKRFMGSICQGQAGQPIAPEQLVPATCATTALGIAAGVSFFRVHDVAANRQAADVAWAMRQQQA